MLAANTKNIYLKRFLNQIVVVHDEMVNSMMCAVMNEISFKKKLVAARIFIGINWSCNFMSSTRRSKVQHKISSSFGLKFR